MPWDSELGSELGSQIPEPTGFNHYPTLPVQQQTFKEVWVYRGEGVSSSLGVGEWHTILVCVT